MIQAIQVLRFHLLELEKVNKPPNLFAVVCPESQKYNICVSVFVLHRIVNHWPFVLFSAHLVICDMVYQSIGYCSSAFVYCTWTKGSKRCNAYVRIIDQTMGFYSSQIVMMGYWAQAVLAGAKYFPGILTTLPHVYFLCIQLVALVPWV